MGLPIAAAGDARRVWSALPRALRDQSAADVVVNDNRQRLGQPASESYLSEIERLPQIEVSARIGGVFLFEVVDGEIDPRLVFGSALGKSVDDRVIERVGTFRLLAGRLPSQGRPDEIVVNPELLRMTGWKVGDDVTTLRLYRADDLEGGYGEPDPTEGEQLRLRIVGEVQRPEEFLVDSENRPPQIYLFPAFVEAHPNPTTFITTNIQLQRGTDVTAFGEAVAEIASRYEHGQANVSVVDDGVTSVRDALRPQVVAVWLLAAVLMFGGAFIAAQAIARQILSHNRDLADLHALGMTKIQLAVVVMLHATVVAVAAAGIAALVGFASSEFTPLGSTHSVEPNSGLRSDAVVLFGGALVVMVLLIAASVIPARRMTRLAARVASVRPQMSGSDRPSRITSLLGRIGARPPLTVGAGLALQPGRGRSATPVRSVLAGVALTAAMLTLTLAFSGSLDHLVRTPRLYGWDWDVAIKNDAGSIPDDAVDALVERPEIGSIAGFSLGRLRIDGHDIATIGVEEIEGTVYPTLEAGRIAQSDHELVLGRSTLRKLHRSIGDAVDVETSDGTTRSMTIVGIATFPGLSSTGLRFNSAALGEGAATVASMFPPDDPLLNGRYVGVLIRVDDSMQKDEALSELRTFVAPLGCVDAACFTLDARPRELSGYAHVTNLWIPFVVSLVLLVLISLTHGLISTTRARRRDLAILAALGFDRRQIRAIVVWQAVIIATVALMIALPLGVIAASIGWSAFTDSFGISPPVRIPFAALLAMMLGTVATAALVGVACAPSTRRTAASTLILE